MSRIFKAEDVVRVAEAVKIPDCVIRVLPEKVLPEKVSSENISQMESAEPSVPSEEISQSISKNESDTSDGSVVENAETISAEEERDRIFIEREAILKQAELEAKKILEDARSEGDVIKKRAQSDADNITEAARKKGYNEGILEKIKEIEECVGQIDSLFKELRSEQDKYFDQCADELKFLSLEIAEKLISQKLEEDSMLILPMVKSAVKSLRDVNWIKVEVSDKLKNITSELEKALKEVKPAATIEIESRRSAPIGTCVVHTTEGVVVASVLTQIENIHKYFSEYKDSEGDE